MTNSHSWDTETGRSSVENVTLGLHPRVTFSTSGSPYFHVPLTTVSHLLNVTAEVQFTDDANGDAGLDAVTVTVVAQQRQQSFSSETAARLTHIATGDRRRNSTVCLSMFDTIQANRLGAELSVYHEHATCGGF